MNAGRYPRAVGIIGGLGPLAGADFYRHLVAETEASADAEHPEVVLISDPGIPSRLDHLFGRGPSPLPRLRAVARRLESAGCRVIALTSITTHAYYQDIAAAVRTPIVDGRRAAAQALQRDGVARPALLTTWPARRLRLLDDPLRAAGIEPCLPDEQAQAAVQHLVEQVKRRGAAPALSQALGELLTRPWTCHADSVLIGCTDISPLVPGLGRPVHDISVIMARAVLAEAEQP
jgi:aspartate racemase